MSTAVRNICSALIQRELTGGSGQFSSSSCLLASDHRRRLGGGQGCNDDGEEDDVEITSNNLMMRDKLLNLRINIQNVLPQAALQAGHICMGWSHCNRFILTYTVRPVLYAAAQNGVPRGNENRPSAAMEFDIDTLYTYKLYFWLFNPFGVSKKYSSVLLFDRNGVQDSNLVIQICQWKFDAFNNDRFLMVDGRSSTPEENPRCYLTLTQIPPTSPCTKCTYPSVFESTQALDPCPTHSLTITLTYELVSPYPKFDPDVCLLVTETATPTILINTGNLLHEIQFNPVSPPKSSKCNLLKADLLHQDQPAELNYYYKNLVPNKEEQVKQPRRFFKRAKQSPVSLKDVKEVKPDVYDVLEEDCSKIDKNYRLFRNRQLADKKYEFVDEYVLRPLRSCNRKASRWSFQNSKQPTSSKVAYVKKCTARITRSYVLLNEESVSTTTEIEDNDYNFDEFPVALPTNVYTDQCQLSMIPNYKAVDKKVVITQTSLDIEILSNDLASIICNKEGLDFNFLIDFDGKVVQTHPLQKTITVLTFLLIQATNANEERHRYKTHYIFEWHPFSQSAKVLFRGSLTQASDSIDQVDTSPSTDALISSLRLYKQNNPFLTNQKMVFDWVSVHELTDHAGIVTLFKEVGQGSPTEEFDDDEEEEFEDDDEVSVLSE